MRGQAPEWRERCIFIKKNGERCKMVTVGTNPTCWQHTDSFAEEREAAIIKRDKKPKQRRLF